MLRELGRVLVNPFYECGSAYVCFAPKATELPPGNEMTLRARNRHPPSLAAHRSLQPLVHNDPRAGCTVQQPLEVKAGELIIGVFPNMRCKGCHRAGIARFQLGKRLEITPCRGTFVLLPSEGFESTQSFRPTSQH